MGTLGFVERWIHLIMTCVSSPSYSILLNGQVGARFSPSHGLRQGHPIFSYLYLICAEGLSVLLGEAERTKAINGVKAARGCPPISYLLFADDSLTFCKTQLLEWQAILYVLQTYEIVSGKCINRQKSSIFFAQRPIKQPETFCYKILGWQNVTIQKDIWAYLQLWGVQNQLLFNLSKTVCGNGSIIGNLCFLHKLVNKSC